MCLVARFWSEIWSKDIDLRSSLFLIPQIFERTCDSEYCSQNLLILVAQNRQGTSRSGPTILNAAENFHRNRWAEKSLMMLMLQCRECVVNFDPFLVGKTSVDLCCNTASICARPISSCVPLFLDPFCQRLYSEVNVMRSNFFQFAFQNSDLLKAVIFSGLTLLP
jgi:hypothetical protein